MEKDLKRYVGNRGLGGVTLFLHSRSGSGIIPQHAPFSPLFGAN